ncbi:EscS/YscS/HrcS family type III secretion system export apparatus protein [candidate division WOR-1 bacterium RIFOXYC2_FULL_37_10]|uniref:Flagellar biosynthetic protein FliQ n=1 Tax=candidate division WOR-1 bacterium RIFOXYB2_FULL_37_13 TaxID=1802579 RepID=A0A1F4SLV9_UNCSA|nr:MAG: EscS/YscS/HrcS family type III secretion system export apparatus protein [candidate division WOR-1 bacterium RIFOXYB2_FULL_37_13]OGC33459.1 MAG: EscS/YscS/HrcS family type III secretion system export apparatus protein [candidate division WOR-1 bacterium RIFOXYC2_FULL_37_10]
MNQDFVVQVMNQGITTVLILSMPVIGVGLLVGFVISLFQAVTQIQEQTLTFVPKVVAVLLLIALTFPWIMSIMVDFTTTLWANIPAMVK